MLNLGFIPLSSNYKLQFVLLNLLFSFASDYTNETYHDQNHYIQNRYKRKCGY